MKITIDYFKQSGEWYMEEEIFVPEEMYLGGRNSGFNAVFSYNFRIWLYEEAQRDEFIGVVRMPENSIEELMLGYPMMIIPKNNPRN